MLDSMIERPTNPASSTPLSPAELEMRSRRRRAQLKNLMESAKNPRARALFQKAFEEQDRVVRYRQALRGMLK
jgi:hypothetical protein